MAIWISLYGHVLALSSSGHSRLEPMHFPVVFARTRLPLFFFFISLAKTIKDETWSNSITALDLQQGYGNVSPSWRPGGKGYLPRGFQVSCFSGGVSASAHTPSCVFFAKGGFLMGYD